MYGECVGRHNSMEGEVLDTSMESEVLDMRMESVWDNIILWRVRY